MRSPRIFRIFTIILISSLCLLLNFLTKINFVNVDLPKDHPEYTAEGIEGMSYNNQGKLNYKVISKSAWQYPNDSKIYMQGINVNIYDDKTDNLKYNILSDKGWVDHKNQIGLLNNAKLTINDTNPSKVIILEGKQIKIDVNKNLFSSTEDVKFVQNQKLLNSHGFSYNYKQEFLTLNSNIKLIYK